MGQRYDRRRTSSLLWWGKWILNACTPKVWPIKQTTFKRTRTLWAGT